MKEKEGRRGGKRRGKRRGKERRGGKRAPQCTFLKGIKLTQYFMSNCIQECSFILVFRNKFEYKGKKLRNEKEGGNTASKSQK